MGYDPDYLRTIGATTSHRAIIICRHTGSFMADNVTVISSMATRQILNALAASQSQNGCPVHVVSVGGVDAARRIRTGEAFDIVVLAADAMQALADEGHIIHDSLREFARSPTAVAVRAGAPRPTLCDETTIRALISGQQRIGLSTGPSGKSVAQLLQSWKALSPLTSRIVQAPPGVPVARLIANGEADVGFQQLSELLGEPGIEIIGTLPESLQPMTTFSCSLGRRVGNITAATAVMAAFTSEDAAATKRQGGMEPGAPITGGPNR
jgi:molybdate transport system substrate-binding protein